MKTACRLILSWWLLSSACLPKVRTHDTEGETGALGATRQCLQDSGCATGESCCIQGLIGTCTTLVPGAGCPRPDLGVSLPENALLKREERFFSPDSAADRCALEKQCVGALGARELLRFPTRVTNLGSADLLLGAPGTTPGFAPAECDGQAYFPNYLHYELLEAATDTVAAEGHLQAPCAAPTNGFVSRFNCEFMGLWQGFSETYGPEDPDCQWVDVTDVPPGTYRLRASVNPDRLLPESDYQNDTAERSIVLPSPGPSLLCPNPYDGLSGVGTSRECGWSVASFSTDAGVSSALGVGCTPGQPVTVGCAGCAGNPMLRVCDGSLPCPAGEALGSSFVSASADLFGDHPCASVPFTCPPSGTYTTLVASYEATPFTAPDEFFYLRPLECELERLP